MDLQGAEKGKNSIASNNTNYHLSIILIRHRMKTAANFHDLLPYLSKSLASGLTDLLDPYPGDFIRLLLTILAACLLIFCSGVNH